MRIWHRPNRKQIAKSKQHKLFVFKYMRTTGNSATAAIKTAGQTTKCFTFRLNALRQQLTVVTISSNQVFLFCSCAVWISVEIFQLFFFRRDEEICCAFGNGCRMRRWHSFIQIGSSLQVEAIGICLGFWASQRRGNRKWPLQTSEQFAARTGTLERQDVCHGATVRSSSFSRFFPVAVLSSLFCRREKQSHRIRLRPFWFSLNFSISLINAAFDWIANLFCRFSHTSEFVVDGFFLITFCFCFVFVLRWFVFLFAVAACPLKLLFFFFYFCFRFVSTPLFRFFIIYK